MYEKVTVDTNILLNEKFDFDDYLEVAIPIVCIEELDGLKKSDTVGYKARRATNRIKNATNVEVMYDYKFELPARFLEHKADNFILGFAWEKYKEDPDFTYLTDDLNLYIKSYAIGLPCDMFEFKATSSEYKGYREVTLSDDELASFYETIKQHKFDMLDNEYLLILNNEGELVDKFRWSEQSGFMPLLTGKSSKKSYTGTKSFNSRIKPRNVQQELAFDLFQNRLINIKVVFGKHGSGKDLIMSYHALKMVEAGVFDTILFVRNNYAVANTKEIGFLKGSSDEKLLPYAMPLADHLGGIDGLMKLIDDKIVELQNFGTIRGRDLKRTLVYVTEAENMTKEHIQLLISRLSEGSALWINGDFRQIDDMLFERNNGMKQAIERLKGQSLFGCVELIHTERSGTARLSDLLD